MFETLITNVLFTFLPMLLIGILSFYLGSKKTNNPIIAGVLGFLFGIFIPFGLIYLCILIFKSDITNNESAQ